MTDVPRDACVIGLGGNVGTESVVRERFVRAREALAALGRTRSARLYRTAPIGPMQPRFLNSAVRVEIVDATPSELIATVLEIEQLLGRRRHEETRWGPRTIDLDVLVYGTRKVSTPELELPHPRAVERRFALRPLIDVLGGDVVLPGQTSSLEALERRVASQALDEIAESW